MKIDIRKATDNKLEIYITRTAFMKEFEAGVEGCIVLIRDIAEMLTSPYCFYHLPSGDRIIETYLEFTKRKTTKGLLMKIIEDETGDMDMEMLIVS